MYNDCLCNVSLFNFIKFHCRLKYLSKGCTKWLVCMFFVNKDSRFGFLWIEVKNIKHDSRFQFSSTQNRISFSYFILSFLHFNFPTLNFLQFKFSAIWFLCTYFSITLIFHNFNFLQFTFLTLYLWRKLCFLSFTFFCNLCYCSSSIFVIRSVRRLLSDCLIVKWMFT